MVNFLIIAIVILLIICSCLIIFIFKLRRTLNKYGISKMTEKSLRGVILSLSNTVEKLEDKYDSMKSLYEMEKQKNTILKKELIETAEDLDFAKLIISSDMSEFI